MPELPEVESVVRGVRPDLEGRTIQAVWMDWPNSLATPDSTIFMGRLPGQQIMTVTRRGKYIVIRLDTDYLLIHLKMTGNLYVVPDDAEKNADRWVHFRFQLDNGHQLRFSDSRKFGKVYLVPDAESVVGKLGPEPLSETFTPTLFAERLRGRKTSVKPLLLDQTFLAGVGNIYADEALHAAHIAPLRRTDSLTPDEIEALYHAIRGVLDKGIARQGASISTYRNPDGSKGTMQNEFLAYGRTGQHCPTCGEGIIEKIIVGQRGTHYCPRCQK